MQRPWLHHQHDALSGRLRCCQTRLSIATVRVFGHERHIAPRSDGVAHMSMLDQICAAASAGDVIDRMYVVPGVNGGHVFSSFCASQPRTLLQRHDLVLKKVHHAPARLRRAAPFLILVATVHVMRENERIAHATHRMHRLGHARGVFVNTKRSL